MKTRKMMVFLLAAVAMLAYASAGFACPVCFGESDAPVVKGIELSVLFMVGVTYVVILGGFATFIVLRRRALRQQAEARAEH